MLYKFGEGRRLHFRVDVPSPKMEGPDSYQTTGYKLEGHSLDDLSIYFKLSSFSDNILLLVTNQITNK
jgi:hypothetical protein